MTVEVIKDARVELNGTVLSGVFTARLEYGADEVDTTSFGKTNKTYEGGLTDWTITLEAHNDYAASALDSVIFPLVGNKVPIKFRTSTAAVGSSNPEYRGTVLVRDYVAFSATVGDTSRATITLRGDDTLTRSTS